MPNKASGMLKHDIKPRNNQEQFLNEIWHFESVWVVAVKNCYSLQMKMTHSIVTDEFSNFHQKIDQGSASLLGTGLRVVVCQQGLLIEVMGYLWRNP